jgi:hypothetical protein
MKATSAFLQPIPVALAIFGMTKSLLFNANALHQLNPLA